MQCYSELTAPTAVTHSLSIPFLSPAANNLLVAKTNLLQIFALKSIVTSASNTLANGLQEPPSISKERGQTTKLTLVAQYELSGTVIALARVKILKSKSGGEALLVALRDAKLSLVEWDPERYSISTISIHYYEREDILASPWEPELSNCVNQLTVDPGSRCAALKFGARHLAILPFHQIGDDLVMDDFDPDFDEAKPAIDTSIAKDGNEETRGTPYASSFVLSLLALDPALTHPIHLSFLYEYREPTFGILYTQTSASSALLQERRDKVSFAIYTLDLEQKASTTLSSVSNLPYDLHTILPLSRAIGGVLLIGNNEVIHVDQSGKSNGVAVNEFAKKSTSFALSDQSDLAMRLEGSLIRQLGWENIDLLIILSSGQLAIITFKIDGRSVSGLSIHRVSNEGSSLPIPAWPSCASYIGRGRMFIGSEISDSVVLGWSRTDDRLKKRQSRMELDADKVDMIADFDNEDIMDDDDEDNDDDEDDLYANDKPDQRLTDVQASALLKSQEEEYRFKVHDSLLNIGPMTDIAFIPPPATAKLSSFPQEILTSSGSGNANDLTSLQFGIHPTVADDYEIPAASALWTLRPKEKNEEVTSRHHDKYIIATITGQDGSSQSRAFSIKTSGLQEVQETDFDPEAGPTIDAGVLNGGVHMVQVLEFELRTFDSDFGLAQIFPLNDDETEDGPRVVRAYFTDPYVLLIRDDQSTRLLKADETGDLDEVEQGQFIKDGTWTSGCMYEDLNDAMRLDYPEDEDEDVGNVLLFLLSAAGGLHIFRLPSLQKPVFSAEGLTFLPPFLSSEFNIRRSSAREDIKEILMAELGDASWNASPYLILRSALDDLIIYQPFQSPVEGTKDTALRFVKIPNPRFPKSPPEDHEYEDESQRRKQPLCILPGLDGHGGFLETIFMPGPSACFIIKSASSPPQVINFDGTSVQSIAPLHTSKSSSGFLYLSYEGHIKAATLPPNTSYTTGIPTRRLSLPTTVSALSFHIPSNTCALGASNTIPFVLPIEEDPRHEPPSPEEIQLRPQTLEYTVQLLDRASNEIVSTHTLDPNEIILCIETFSLEISEITHEHQDMVCVGTTLLRGEDLPSMGRIYVFAIIDVVPEPDHPETGKALKLFAKEEVRGAVSSLSGVGTQGFLMVAMGQKIMVRGLKEDGTLLPVAFMDVQCYVSVARELGPVASGSSEGSGLCLIGDAVKGVWLAGYMEDPYQLRFFSKSPHHIETISADFLPDGKQLYIVVADADCNLHILQFDPDNPKSLHGTRLIHHSTFHTSHYPSTLSRLPPSFFPLSSPHNSSTSNGTPGPLLLTSPTGALSLLTPLPQQTHRTLTSLQTHCLNSLSHPLGLNPRSYRQGGGGGASGGVGSGAGGMGGTVIDGMVVRRWEEAGTWRRWGGEEREGVREALRAALGGW